MNQKPSRTHEEATIESFRRDPAFAEECLNAVLEDGEEAELLLALRRITEAFGGVWFVSFKSVLTPSPISELDVF